MAIIYSAKQKIYRGGGKYRERWVPHKFPSILSQMWMHPLNDQRPAVLDWLSPYTGSMGHVLDIGPGDAYYLKFLSPREFTFVEPDQAFRRLVHSAAQDFGIPSKSYQSVQSLLGTSQLLHFDTILLLHVVFYLTEDEITTLLASLPRIPCFIVYPDPMDSISVEFENSVGLTSSKNKISILHSLWGMPNSKKTVQTHFRLPLEIELDQLAILISHHLPKVHMSKDLMTKARSFVSDNIEKWQKPGFIELPQSQIMEVYHA